MIDNIQIGDLSGYDWGNMNHAYDKYKTTKTYNEFLAAILASYPEAFLRDYEIMWMAFDRADEDRRDQREG